MTTLLKHTVSPSLATTLSPALNFVTSDPSSTTSPAISVTVPTKIIGNHYNVHNISRFVQKLLQFEEDKDDKQRKDRSSEGNLYSGKHMCSGRTKRA